MRTFIIRALLRKKCLEEFRLPGENYSIAIDGTGRLSFKRRHCGHCLERKPFDHTTLFYHPVLEAKLVFSNGLALSIATEFIENEKPDVKKQDCELKAFYRLAEKLKQTFPQLRICLLLDAVHNLFCSVIPAGNPGFSL